MEFLGEKEKQGEIGYLVVVYKFRKFHKRSTISRCKLTEVMVSKEAVENLCRVTLEPGGKQSMETKVK